MIRTPTGHMREADALALFDQCGFVPPADLTTQEAFELLVDLARKQQAQDAVKRPGRGRTAVLPTPPTVDAATAVLAAAGCDCAPLAPCGVEVRGLDVAASGGRVAPDVAGALEVLMAHRGLVLLRGQGRPRRDAGVAGVYLSGDEQCALSECFGAGALHSTHGVHPSAPCRDVFRLSNDPDHGFNSVGTEWHNDGSFCRDVFSQGRKRVIQVRFNMNVPRARVPQRKHPRVESAPRDDRSFKNEPKRVGNGRERSL